jgi:hypothetical protein
MVICTSQLPEDIVEILGGARKGTKFYPLANSLKGRKRWLLTGERLWKSWGRRGGGQTAAGNGTKTYPLAKAASDATVAAHRSVV